MGLSKLIEVAAKQYPIAKQGEYSKAPIGNEFKETIPNQLKQEFDLSNYKVEGSIGRGGFANVPWIAVMDPNFTKSTKNGVYIVFLVSSDGERVYLSLNQGVTYFNENRYSPEHVRRIGKLLQDKFPSESNTTDSIDLNPTTKLAMDYEKANVYSYVYETNNMPSDEEIHSDFTTLLERYAEIIEYFISEGSDIEKFYFSLEKSKLDSKYQEFKYLLNRFLSQANDNLVTKTDRKATMGELGFEKNNFEREQDFDRIEINNIEIDVHLFSSGHYGPKDGNGSIKAPYICFYIGNETWANLRVNFSNSQANTLRIVTWDRNKKNGEETGLSYNVNDLDLFSNEEPNESLIKLYDDFFGKQWLINGTQEKEDEKMQPIDKVGWNKILYGPPGTGKTYSINKYKEDLIKGQSLERSRLNFDLLTWKEVILLAMKRNEYLPLDFKDVTDLDLIQQYAKTKSSKNTYQTIAMTVRTNADENSGNISLRNGLNLFTKDQSDKWSVTEEGKIAADEAELYVKDDKLHDEDFFVKLVTFHQSYGYEDFIEGINAETEDGKISYQIKDGVFKRFCNDAKQYPDKNFLFVIDEINRGNISKIFGELITLIEPSKRLKASEELSVILPYSGDIFGVPQNVYILGTMNTADRSIAMMDTALRRRFDFIEKMPDSEIVRKNIGQIEGIDVASILETMNRRIEFLYDREHTLGHAFFLNISTLQELKLVFENKIIPLLQEYFYEDYEKIQAVLNDTQHIYVEQLENDSNLFANVFKELKNDNEEIKYKISNSVNDEEFIRFALNITKVGD